MSYNTVQDVFDKTIHWIDAQNESNGSTNTVDTKEYSFRTPNILNMFLNVVYPASDTYQSREDRRRPYLEPVSEMTDELDLDAYICMSVLPYALAAGLLQEENPDVADTAMQLYEENLLEAKNRLGAEDGEVENAYGGIEYGRFSRW
jgi:hypothetical protein